MRNQLILNPVMMSCVAAVVSLAIVGCETQPVTETISIDPQSATLHYGESVTFTASGGFDYTWSLSNTSLGTLSNTTGPTTTYTSLYNATTSGATAVQTITASAGIEDTASSTNATFGSARVTVNHI